MSAASELNMSGVIGSRPAFGIAGRFYLASDTNALSYDTGAAWIAAGSVGPAGELGYTQITTASLTTASGSLVDLTGVTVTVTIGSRPVLVSAYIAQWSHSANNGRAGFALVDVTAGATIQLAIPAANGAGDGSSPIWVAARVNPASGSRTYKVQFEAVDAGTITSNASSTQPAFIQVVEV